MRTDSLGKKGIPSPTTEKNASAGGGSGSSARLLHGITIPPRPAVLVELQEKLLLPDTGIEDVTRVISSDVGLAGTVLKTVNSPHFGLGSRIGSVSEAVGLLGINNISNICARVLLRASLESKGISLERFWDSATDIATISRSLAIRLGDVSGDDAYTLGLLHDCGIPLLMRKFPDYRDVLKIANNSKYKTGAQVEDERYHTDHTTVGYFVCKSWYLPLELCEAVRNHHNQEIWSETAHSARKVKSMIGIVQMAEKISHAYRVGHSHLTHAQRRDQTYYYEWENIKLDVFNHFSLNESAYHELHADMIEQLQENA